MSRWTREPVREHYPHGTVTEWEWRLDEDAEPDCDRCEDRGEWVGPGGWVEPCPDCGGHR